MSLTSFSSITITTMHIEIFCSKSSYNSCTLTIEISVVYYHAMYSLQNNIDFKCSFQSPRLMRALRLPKRFCWLLWSKFLVSILLCRHIMDTGLVISVGLCSSCQSWYVIMISNISFLLFTWIHFYEICTSQLICMRYTIWLGKTLHKKHWHISNVKNL